MEVSFLEGLLLHADRFVFLVPRYCVIEEVFLRLDDLHELLGLNSEVIEIFGGKNDCLNDAALCGALF
mgnify:CR=1 FL=1